MTTHTNTEKREPTLNLIQGHRSLRKIIAWVLTLVILLGVMPTFTLPVFAIDSYAALQTAAGAGGSGNITLTGNITGTTQLTIERTLTLDLAGYTLTIYVVDSGNGIKINSGVTLTIIDSSLSSAGTLNVTRSGSVGGNGAAINTTDGTLIISSGTINATSSVSTGGGAGIGGGQQNPGGTITINGGNVTATGGGNAAGIGGGAGGSGGTITINGGTVNATGGNAGAGIGGGYAGGAGGIIKITGGTVIAQGGNTTGNNDRGGGAGIGGGGGADTASGASGNITIEGNANVTAIGGNSQVWGGGAGIGSGGGGGWGGTIGNVGEAGNVSNPITINTSGSVTASGGTGSTGNGAAIGTGGSQGSTGNPSFTISIGTHPASSTTVTQGSITGSLSVAANISPTTSIPLTYQWYSNTTNSNSGGTVISGATNASFSIPTTLTPGTYYYYAVVSALGANPVPSNAATLTVNAPPPASITVGSQTGTLTYGTSGNATYTVAGNNFTSPAFSPTVQWQGTAPTGVTPIFNPGNTQLTLASSATTNAGTYTFRVVSGDVESANVTLVIGRAAGAALTGTLNVGSITHNSVTLSGVSNNSGNGQTIEYGYNTTNNAGTATWGQPANISGLNPETDYYFFARSQANINYNAGTAIISAVTKTARHPDNISIDNAKTAIETHTFTAVPQATLNTQAAANAHIKGIVDNLIETYGVTATVNNISFTAAQAGTVGSLNGTNGSYTFTVTLNKGTGIQQTTAQRTVAITATPYDASQDDTDITAAFGAVTGAFPANVPQATLNTETAAKSHVENIVNGLVAAHGVNATVNTVSFGAATAGAYPNVNGTNGSYVFTVSLNKGAGTQQTTGNLTLNITATAAQTFAVTVLGGTGATGAGNYAQGSTVNISAGTPPSGQQFKEWTTSSPGVNFANANSASTSFTMPANAATVTALFETIPTFTITASPSPLNFGSLQTPYTQPAEQTVTVTNTGNSAITLNQPTATNYVIGALSATTLDTNGAAATFTVRPKAGLSVGTYNETITVTGSGGASAAVNANFAVTAAPVKTVNVGSQNGTLTAGTAGAVTFPVTTANIINGTYTVTLSGAPAGVTAANITINNNNGTLTLNTTAATSQGNHPLTATIDGAVSNSFNLVVGAAAVLNPPAITTSPGALAVGTVGTAYNSTLAATNSPTSWAVSSGTLPAGLLLNNSGVISGTPTTAGTAIFSVTATNADGTSAAVAFSITINAALVTHALTITAGTGGTITQGTSGNYAQNAVINISASPSANYVFSHWTSSNGGVFANVNSASTTFTMPGNATTVTAHFIYVPPVMTYSFSVSADSGGWISGMSSGSYTAGTWISVTANANSNYSFSHWSASGVTLSNQWSSSVSFTMPANSVSLTAHFNYNDPGNGGEPTTPPTPSHSFGDGGSTFVLGSNTPIILTVHHAFSQFNNVRINGWNIARDRDFTARQGSTSGMTVITLLPVYLNTLSVGQHTVTVNFWDGASVTVNITIQAAPTAPDPVIRIGGIDIRYTMDANGIVTLFPTEAQIRHLIETSPNGNIVFDVSVINGARGVILEAHPDWFSHARFQSLTLRLNAFGSVVINRGVFTALRTRNNQLLRFSMTPGSLTFDILTANDGRTINYNDPAHPLFISIPVRHAADTTTNGYVAVRRTATGNVIIPYSIYRNGEIIFQTPSTGSFGTTYNARTFTDTAQHWAAGYITFAAARGIAGGDGTGRFLPEGSMTRAMFVQILANIEQINFDAYRNITRFTDVSVNAWFAPAIEWAASVGLASGYGDGRFGPDDNITREQMAALLVRYARYKGYELPSMATIAFNDEASISSWAFNDVKRIQAAGIIVGKPGNVFDPHGTATRAEAMTIFARLIEVYLTHAIPANRIASANDNPSTGGGTAATNFNPLTGAYIDRKAIEAIERALAAGNGEQGNDAV